MVLSAKQIALFGQVKIVVKELANNRVQYITLLELYRSGWWVTERFGTIITLVKPRKILKDGFCCVNKRVVTDINLESLDIQTKLYADKKLKQYKEYLESKKRKNHEDNLPML